MSDEQLRDETVTLFLAGHETTALALTYALYLLALHPEIEARAADEVRDALEGRRPTADDVPRLAYLERVLKEAMRLYPPAWVIGREVLKPIMLGGVRVEPGVQVVASQWLVHRDARFWPEPERFEPSRFEPSASEGRRRFAYFPFGGGPRVCIGNHFAMMEAVILLALVLARFRVELVPGQTLDFAPSVTLQPKAPGVRVVLRPRG
jgi:cytochrome P450